MTPITKSPRFFLGILFIVVLLLTTFFYRNETLSFLGVIRSFQYEELEALELENLVLRAEVEELREKSDAVGDSYVEAKVYSRYPFNDRRSVVVNLGGKDGIRKGMPVLAREGVLLGKVKSVFGRQSLVETIFDPAWRSSAIIGGPGGSGESSVGVKALVEGGINPSLTLISKESIIVPGDRVWNISPEFPFGLLLGELSKVKPTSDDIWLAAELHTLYDFEDLTKVLIVTNFP